MEDNKHALFEIGENQIFTSDLVSAIVNGDLDLVDAIINKSKPAIRKDKADVIGKENLFKVNEGEIHERNGSYIQGYRRGMYDLAQDIQLAMMERKNVESGIRNAFETQNTKEVLDHLSKVISATISELMDDLGYDRTKILNILIALDVNDLIKTSKINETEIKCCILNSTYLFTKTQRYNDLYEEITRADKIEKAIRYLKSALIE